MKLYLVQHGEALPAEADSERPLSAAGRRDVEALARFLAARGLRIERIQHSGKTRARQTAEILAGALAPGLGTEARPGLAPKDPVEAFVAGLAEDTRDRLVVGHLPFMDRLVAHLVGGGEARGLVAYRPGAMVCLERAEDGAWRIAWMLRPELLA
ncbi:MAG: phosphohistidine phosphatase SixA [Rhodospirillales bacterium]|nr:phosphohistidine phosphatase SixA [Rhodospirillales bacterium]